MKLQSRSSATHLQWLHLSCFVCRDVHLISRWNPCGYSVNDWRSSILGCVAICAPKPVDAGREGGWRSSGNGRGGRLDSGSLCAKRLDSVGDTICHLYRQCAVWTACHCHTQCHYVDRLTRPGTVGRDAKIPLPLRPTTSNYIWVLANTEF